MKKRANSYFGGFICGIDQADSVAISDKQIFLPLCLVYPKKCLLVPVVVQLHLCHLLHRFLWICHLLLPQQLWVPSRSLDHFSQSLPRKDERSAGSQDLKSSIFQFWGGHSSGPGKTAEVLAWPWKCDSWGQCQGGNRHDHLGSVHHHPCRCHSSHSDGADCGPGGCYWVEVD